MEQQNSIPFQPNTPVARATDCKTSHLAAASVKQDGSRAKQAKAVLAALHRWPNSTARELAHLSGLDKEVVHRRLPELADPKNGGPFVQRCFQKRTCRVTGKLAMTWLPL